MLNISSTSVAFICAEPIDMRSSFDSLSGMVKSHLKQNPLSGDLYVFFSRRRDRIKVLLWELDGYSLYYKRLERGTFGWIQNLDLSKQSCEISSDEFALLLSSITIQKNAPHFRSHHEKKTSLHLV
jgi:hypothetical protein